MLRNDPCFYDFPSESDLSKSLHVLIDAERALAAADARIRVSPLKRPLLDRLRHREAVRYVQDDGWMVYVDELARLDAHLGRGEDASAGTSCAWKYLNWLRSIAIEEPEELLLNEQPGQRVIVSNAEIAEGLRREVMLPGDPNWNYADRLAAWRFVLDQTQALPPLMAAALAWDAFWMLDPNQGGGYRGAAIAALVLKARKHTRGWMLPIVLGRKPREPAWRDREQPERLQMFLGWIAPAARTSLDELSQLERAVEALEGRVGKRRKHSKLPQLMDLVIESPVITTGIVAHRLKISMQGADKLIGEIASCLRLISSPGEERIWTASIRGR